MINSIPLLNKKSNPIFLPEINSFSHDFEINITFLCCKVSLIRIDVFTLLTPHCVTCMLVKKKCSPCSKMSLMLQQRGKNQCFIFIHFSGAES